MFAFLHKIGLYPYELKDSLKRKKYSYLYKELQSTFKDACAVLILLSGEDEAKPREKTPLLELNSESEIVSDCQPRLNVLFEAGVAFALCPKSTILVKLGYLNLCSDLSGRSYIELNKSRERRQELIEELKRVGCIVNLSKHDWVDVGDFSDPNEKDNR